MLYVDDAGLPQPGLPCGSVGKPDHTLVSLKPFVLTAVLTAAFCTGSISLNSSGSSALYVTAGIAGAVVVPG